MLAFRSGWKKRVNTNTLLEVRNTGDTLKNKLTIVA